MHLLGRVVNSVAWYLRAFVPCVSMSIFFFKNCICLFIFSYASSLLQFGLFSDCGEEGLVSGLQ